MTSNPRDPEGPGAKLNLVFAIVIFVVTSIVTSAQEWPYNLGDCRVLLTVSPLTRPNKDGSQTLFRDLVASWEYSPYRCANQNVDRVELIDNEPSKPHKTVWSKSLSKSGIWSGHETTNISISPYGEAGNVAGGAHFPPKLPCGWDPPPLTKGNAEKPLLGSCCLSNHWLVAYNQDGSVHDSTCVRTQPTWMQDNAHIIANLTLNQIFWPGTHNTGSYARYDYEESALWRFILTQDTPLWHQLVLGVRYFDFRIGYYPDPIGAAAETGNPDVDYKFWVNHDMIRVQPFLPLLRDLRTFMLTATKEVVILDLHRFPVGFEASNESDPRATAHEKLLDLLQTELGDLLAISPPSMEGPQPRLKALQDGPGRILVFYGKKGFAETYPFLWPPLNQVWGDARQAPALMAFLEKAMGEYRHKRQIWAAMAELTPSAYDVVFNFAGSLRKLAEDVNYNISSELFYDWQYDANIVAVDFVMGSSVIEAALVANYKRGKTIVDDDIIRIVQGSSPVHPSSDSDHRSAPASASASTETDYYYYDEIKTATTQVNKPAKTE